MTTTRTETRTGTEMGWGSDAVAALLRELDLGYAALVPGASYRGLHDSIVNYLGNENPEMLLCLHEEHAVAIAHGYAKITGKPMLAVVHSNVGLMHASMAVFNAWCDRAPVLILGANGPVDAAKRRPWIDWIHTSQDMGALVRPYTKWDDQPGSPRAALESLLRAYQIAATLPYGPTIVFLDAGLQEEKLAAPLPMPPVAKYAPPEAPAPAAADVKRVLAALKGAQHPVILAGRCSRTTASWDDRVALAEALNARVITEFKIGAMFPTDHPLHAGQSGSKPANAALREADVILDLDSVDLGGILKVASGSEPLGAKVIAASMDRYVHGGWSMDYQALPALDINLAVPPDALVSALLEAIGNPKPKPPLRNGAPARPKAAANGSAGGTEIGIDAFSSAVSEAFAGREVCFTRLPLGVDDADFVFHHPLDYIGGDGGGGIGSGLGTSVGAALALRGTSRMPVCLTGDGDFLMGNTALWTAVQSKIPLLVIVANNRSFFNDEVHQERMAVVRGRPVERKWIGQRIDGPPPDLAGFARAQGAIGIGPVTDRNGIVAAIEEGIRHVQDGKVCVIDVVVLPEYSAGVAAGVTHAMESPSRGGGERG
jgi:thiamine pyrophosphate-dependent acetolactate synthase large subunit-like protein